MPTLHQSGFDCLETESVQAPRRAAATRHRRVPTTEVHESEAGYNIYLELPGLARDSIDVKATDRNLVISAECRDPQPESTEAPEAAQTPPKLLSEIRYCT